MAHIVSTRPLIDGGLSGVRDEHTLTVCDPPDGSTRSVDELIALADGADVLLSVLADPITEALFEARPGLQMVSQYAVGVDNIDLEAAEAHDVAVTHTPGVLTDATADQAWALLLAAARLVQERSGQPDSGEISPQQAGAALAAAPIIIIFLIFQKYFTQGIAMGAVKG